jgi:hypothetical protein
MLEDQWVVVDGCTVSAIDAQGLVRVLGRNRQGRHFTTMACNVGTGIEPGSWRCVLWDPKLEALPSARWAMAYRNGTLLVCRTLAPKSAAKDPNQGMPRFGVIDLKTGRCEQVCRDGVAAHPMHPGLGAGPLPEPPRKAWAHLDLCHGAALAPDGRIGFACQWEVGQFRPDWHVPEPPPASVQVGAVTPEARDDSGAKTWSVLRLLKDLNGNSSQPGPR